MKVEAIQQLEQFKAQLNGSQVETNSISETKPKRNHNYPKHTKPLQERIMSAVAGSGLRTSQSIAEYCGESEVKVVNMHLGRLLSSGKLVRYTNPASKITRYYTPDEAKAKGYKPDAQPKKEKIKRSSSVTAKLSADKQTLHVRIDDGKPSKSPLAGKDYVAFLEKRVTEWQMEARKQAQEIQELRDALSKSFEPRQGSNAEIAQLKATITYLESKLFGSK